MSQTRSIVLTAVLLFLSTLALYYPAWQNDFVNYDDPAYVTANAQVQQGLTAANTSWAFTSTAEANWHPLTWLSHMADVSLFRMNPRGHHAQSVFWHALNVVLLLLLLVKATGSLGRSAIVAALFVVHPLNVESVAWVAERKTVLCTFFLLLTLGAYGWYVKRPSATRYLLVILLFALGLMAKPMLITLPFALLLLDFWPLERYPATGISRLVIEKMPLAALSAASAAITLYAERVGGAVGTRELLPISLRLKNAIYSYAIYIEKTFWPTRLAVFYPHPEQTLALWKVVVAAGFLGALTAVLWRLRKDRYLLVGWLWFLGTLVPVIGIVQVGRQAWADRYGYIPLWGLFVIVVWLISSQFDRVNLSRTGQIAIAIAVLLGYATASRAQVGFWKNSYTLFAHAVEVTTNNGIAEANLGAALIQMGRPDIAAPHLERAIELVPSSASAHYNLATLLHRANQLGPAEHEYRLALHYAIDTHEVAQSHNNLGVLLNQLGKRDEAIAEFTKAIQADPMELNSYIGRGHAEREQGKLEAALADFTRATQIAPSPATFYWQGRVFEKKNEMDQAAIAYESALKLAPGFGDAQIRLENMRQSHK